ncbi:MAG: cell wall metabolism sensor histidine kinase WalK [Candidatus Omnitrophica bacterium]|nr:cell wall metabolism sensor histidine kinase WalK [Candidatus Omnitrophota bacterium]
MKIKLHWKLTFIFCSVIVFGLLIGYFYLLPRLSSYFENSFQNSLKRQLFLNKHWLETYFIEEILLLQEADNLADRIGKELGIRVTIIAIDGEVLGDSDLTKDELKNIENHLNRVEIQEAQKKGFGMSKRFSNTLKKYLLYMAVPLGKDKPLGFLRFAVPLQDLKMLEEGLKRIVILALFLILLLGLGLTSFVSRIVSKPLTEMADVAKAYARGDFFKKPSIHSKDEIGELAKTLSIMSEEIKDKIEKIKQEGARFNTVLSSMFEGIIVTDENGQIILMNPSIRKLFSIDSNPEGKRPIEVIRDITVQNIVDEIIGTKQKFVSKEIIVNFPQEKILKVNGVAIIREDRLEGAILVFHDITELRRLERIRQDFVANVSHELRTPVSSIKGYAETLLEGAIEDKDNAKEFISIIYHESNRLAHLIDDLLDLSKIESGKMKMVFSPLEINPIVKNCVDALEKQAKQKSISISLDLSDNLPKVLADEKRLSQVFLNLLDNAIKYTPQGGSVKISASLKEKFVQIDVADTGIGIAEKDLSRIFERFYRVDKARSRELGGTGLGLSIVKHIVLAHGGQVWVKSQLGAGSTFSFTLPKA